ncbi:NEDD8-conjugating enzyme UBC12, partial [Taenia solium]
PPHTQMTSPAAQRTFMKDLQQLYKTIDASTDGQAFIVGIDEMTVKVSLRPKSGYNAHAEFLVTIECCATYPMTYPKVSFDTPIFHPNIDPLSGTVCISILNEWQSCYSLLDLVKAFLYLIDHPNFDSPINPVDVPENSAQLARNSVRLLAGLPINGHRFPPNPAWVQWARLNSCLPSEEEGELEEAEVEARKNEEFDQYGGEEINKAANAAALEDKKSTIAPLYASTETTSDTVPSFAKIRHFLNPDEETSSWGPYVANLPPFEVRSQRILIWPPNDDNKSGTFTVFFFVEFLGTSHHRFDLGENYSTLFIGNVLQECQSHQESRQTSSNCPCMFADNETPMHDLTADFCPWSTMDGKGVNALFDGLFFDGNQNRGNFTCFLDKDSDSDSESQVFELLFDSCASDYKGDVMKPEELSKTGSQCGFSNHVEKSPSESEVSLTETQESDINETDDEGEKAPSSISSTTYKEVDANYAQITECPDCRYDRWYLSEPIDAGLTPLWKWNFRLTRWPFRFAPQQNVDLSMTGIRIPPWRTSSGRMMSDVCHFCSKNQDVSSLVLLDPMVSHLT